MLNNDNNNNNIQGAYTIQINDSKDLVTAFTQLNARLNKVTRDATAWDAYRIVEVVRDQASFDSIKNKLPIFTSLVIGTDPFSRGEVTYKPGDIVYRTEQYGFEHIKAERGGIFSPVKLTQTKIGDKWSANFTLTYDFLTKIPTETAKNSIDPTYPSDNSRVWTVDNNLKNFTFNNISVDTPNSIYGLSIQNEGKAITFDAEPIEESTAKESLEIENTIRPIIKCLSSNGEEILTDYTITFSRTDKKYTIDVLPMLVNQVVIK